MSRTIHVIQGLSAGASFVQVMHPQPGEILVNEVFFPAGHCHPFDPLKSGHDFGKHTGIPSHQAMTTGPSIVTCLQIHRPFAMSTRSHFGSELALRYREQFLLKDALLFNL